MTTSRPKKSAPMVDVPCQVCSEPLGMRYRLVTSFDPHTNLPSSWLTLCRSCYQQAKALEAQIHEHHVARIARRNRRKALAKRLMFWKD
jgi:hypothetical protein